MDGTWAGVSVGAIAVVPAYVGLAITWTRAGVADGRAERAEERAEGALELAQQANEQYKRIGDALDRLNGSAPPSPTAPPVDFMIEHRKGSRYALRNLGPEDATGIVLHIPEGIVTRTIPTGIDLARMQSHAFMILATSGSPLPGELQLSCDQLDKPVLVFLPAKL